MSQELDDCIEAIEDARSKIVYLRDNLENIESDVMDLQNELETKADINCINDFSSEIDTNTQKLQELDTKLTAIARHVILANRKLRQEESETEAIQDFYKTASQKEIQKGICDACESQIHIVHINNARCPNCNALFVDVKNTPRFDVNKYVSA